MAEITLQTWNIQRPTKIKWVFPATHATALDGIQSKSLKKFLNRSEEYLTQHTISWRWQQLSLSDFLNWLPYYQTKMQENHFDIIANQDWYEQRTAEGKTVWGIFFTQNDQLVASGIVFNYETSKTHLAFKASDRLDLAGRSNSSIGSVVDYFFIQKALADHCTYISGGLSRNAFGVINTLGYLDFKLKMGYQPYFPDQPEFVTTAPLNDQGQVICFGTQNNQPPQFFAFSEQTEPKWWLNIVPILDQKIVDLS